VKEAGSRSQLISKLDKFIKNLSPDYDKKLEEEIRHDARIELGKFYSLRSGRASVEELSDPELFWLISAASRVSKRIGKPEDFFEDGEITRHKLFVPEDEKTVERPLVFKKAVELAKNQWMFPLSVREIQRLKAANILHVDPNLQRNTIRSRYDELQTKVNRKTAKQIADLIDEGKFFYNAIRFNLMDDGESDEPVYDESRMLLTIYDGTIIVPDGNHRTIGCELAKRHLEDQFCVLFTYLDARDSRTLLNQEWTTVPIPKKHKEAMKQTFSNEIVDGIIRSEMADTIYSRRISKDGYETKAGHGFILYTELANAINDYYDADNLEPKSKRDELRDWLISYLNFLTELLFDDFKNYVKSRKTRWIAQSSACRFYIMISKYVRDSEDWKEEVRKIIDSYDFNDSAIRDIFVSPNKRAIRSYIKEQEEKVCIMLNKKNNS